MRNNSYIALISCYNEVTTSLMQTILNFYFSHISMVQYSKDLQIIKGV